MKRRKRLAESRDGRDRAGMGSESEIGVES